MDFSKYDRAKRTPKNLEKGFTAADYDDHRQAPGMQQGWMASSAVIRLLEYVRKNQNRGMILYERFGEFGLKFDPGIKRSDIKNGRVDIAMNILTLLDQATADLKVMIAAGVAIPLMVHYQVEASGSFSGSGAHTARRTTKNLYLEKNNGLEK